MRTIVYVDGFNLYYGLLRGTRHKWLDLRALFGKLLPKNDIVLVKYFTARIVAFPGNPAAPRRQATYLRALLARPSVEIHLGHFLKSEVTMRLADGSGQWNSGGTVSRTHSEYPTGHFPARSTR